MSWGVWVASIAWGLAACSDSGGSAAAGGTSSGAAQVCVDTINADRQKVGLPPLARWTDGEACADGQAASDAQSGRAHGAFGRCGENAQNECPGWPGPDSSMVPRCLAQMWAEGPGGGHYDNMTSARATKVACGFATLAGGKVWAVMNFR